MIGLIVLLMLIRSFIQEEKLLMENSSLREKYHALPLLELATRTVEAAHARSPGATIGGGEEAPDDNDDERRRWRQKDVEDVETELVIGRPGTHI